MHKYNNTQKYPYIFPVFYALIFMSLAVFSIFMPVYLDKVGYNGAQVGILTASGSIVALFSQPFWGVVSDRAKTKNSVLSLLLLLSSIIILLFRLSEGFYFILLFMIILAFFQNPTFPISDAITLEYMTPIGWKFGPVRLFGTIGYAVIAVVAGEIVKRNMNAIFVFSFAIGIVTFLASLRLPKVAGHQAAGKKVSIFELFKNRELILLMIFTVSIHGTLSFYNAFFGIYYTQMGADNALLGWAVFISAISEVFFLIWGDRVILKIGIKPTLFGAALVAVIRWLFLGFVNNVYLVLALQVLHGFIYIVLSYSMAMYINKEVPQELKASGQSLNAVITLGVSKIIGNIGGGMLSDRLGIRQVFIYCAITVAVFMAAFGVAFLVRSRKKQILSGNT